jgi:hypothetical protein
MRRRFGAFTDGGFGPRPSLASRKFTRYHVLWWRPIARCERNVAAGTQVAMPVPYEGRRLIVALLVVLALLAFTAYWWFDMR